MKTYLRKTRRERFWDMVHKSPDTPESQEQSPPGACWIWKGAQNHGGYGRFEQRQAYRVAYEWQIGPIAEGMQIDHLCHERLCVRPSHLEMVTPSTNTRRRGRHYRQRKLMRSFWSKEE